MCVFKSLACHGARPPRIIGCDLFSAMLPISVERGARRSADAARCRHVWAESSSSFRRLLIAWNISWTASRRPSDESDESEDSGASKRASSVPLNDPITGPKVGSSFPDLDGVFECIQVPFVAESTIERFSNKLLLRAVNPCYRSPDSCPVAFVTMEETAESPTWER